MPRLEAREHRIHNWPPSFRAQKYRRAWNLDQRGSRPIGMSAVQSRAEKAAEHSRSAAPRRVQNRLFMNVPRPGVYRLAPASLGRESKMPFHQRNNISVATRTHHSPSKRPELELACSKISTSISCGTDEERGLCVKDIFLIERIRQTMHRGLK